MTKIGDVKINLPDNERMKGLLTDLSGKRITMQEFDQECAYWLISCSDLRPKLLPTKPQKLVEYEEMDWMDKVKVPKSFWARHDVYGYTETYQQIKSRNAGLLLKLKEFKEYIPEQDTVTRSKYDIAINQFWN